MDEFEITNRDEIRSFLDEFFESFFEEQLDEEYFDQESDRLDAAQDARRFMGLVDDYEAGEISWEELISEENLPRDMLSYDDTFTDYYNAIMSSFEAEEIISALETNPERLNDPVFDRLSFPQTEQIITDSALTFAGVLPSAPVTTTGTPPKIIIRGGAGVTITTGNILQNVEGILRDLVPYIPGVSLPNWMPTAGVIFLPTVGKTINTVNEIAGDIINEVEEGESIGEILGQVGAIVVKESEEITGELREQWEGLRDTITEVFTEPKRDKNGNIIYKRDEDGNIIYDEDGNAVTETTINPTGVSGVLAGVITGSYPDLLPGWMPDLLGGILIENLPNVYNSVRDILIGSGATTAQIFPSAPTPESDPDIPISTDPDVDPTLMFTNRGNNVFVSKEGDEFFVLSESEDVDFELNGQYTREQLENTGLETVDSGRYQELLNNLSFHALEEDIYQYTMADLVARYEEEGGVLPGDWKLMDEESQYSFFLDDYFDVPVRIEDPDRGEGPVDEEPPVEPELEPEPPTDEPESAPEMDTSVIEGLFADFLEQIDTEFTGQQEQINTIINNFVQTLPDFDAMPTMADIAEYFEINGVTLSQQNFDRIRQELANAGYLTQEQLTEALAGVATPEQVQQAIEGAGFATPEQVIQALAEAGYATPADITAALNNSGFVTEDRMLQALAEAGYATPEQVEQIVNNAVSNIVIPEGATTEEVRQLIQEAINGIPAGISLDDVSGVVNEAIANIDFPEGLSDSDVRNIVGSFGFTTSDEVRGIINEAIAGIVIPEGATTEEVRQLIQEAIEGIPPGISLDEVGGLINEAIKNIDFPPGLSGDDVRGIVDSFGFATTENVQDIVNTAIANIQFPEGATTEEVRQLIQEALNGLPEGISLEDIGGIVNEAIANIKFPEGLSSDDVRGIVDSFGFATSADVQVGFDNLNDKIDNVLNGVATQFTEQEAEFAADLLGLETSVFQQLAATEGALRDELLGLGEDLDSIRADFSGRFDDFADTFSAFQTDVSGQFETLNDKVDDAVNGLSVQLTEQEATFLAELTGVEASVLQQLAATEGGLRSELETLGFNLTEFQSDVAGRFDQFEDTFAVFQTDVGEQFADLNDRFDDAINGIATQFSDQEAEFLAGITGLEASLIQSLAAVEGGLSTELEMLDRDLVSLREDVAGRFDEFQETFVGFQADVTGQFGDLNNRLDDALNGIATQFTNQEAAFLETVTGVEASVLQQLAATEGGLRSELETLGFNLASLQADVSGRFDEFEQTVGQQLTQAEQDRVRIEQSLNDKLDLQAEGQIAALNEAEARLLSEITGVEATVLQQISTVAGGLNTRLENIGTDLDSVRRGLTASIADVRGEVRDVESSLQNALALQAQGQLRALTESEARLLAEITGGDAALLQELSTQTGGLQQQLSNLGFNITDVESRLGEQITTGLSEAQQDRLRIEQGLYNALQLQSQGQAVELNEAEARLLAEITGGDAALLQEMSSQTGALENQLTSLGLNLNTVQQNLSQDIRNLQAFTGFGFSEAQQERQELQRAIIAVDGDVTQLSDAMYAQFQEQNQSIEELFEGTNVNIAALQAGQISQTEALQDYQAFSSEQFSLAQQERLNLTQNLIGVGARIEELSAEDQRIFNELNLSVEDLQEEFNVNLVGLRQGQIDQTEALNQFQQGVNTRLGLGEQQREEILTRQEDFERVYGEQQEELQQQITSGNILAALGLSGMFGGGGGAPSAPAPAPFKGFMKELTYSPLQVPELAIKTPALDYNEESQKLLRRIRKPGMLTDTGRVA